MIDPGSFDAVTFDCYGTLIDWESGIAAALLPVCRAHRIDADRAMIVSLFGRLERAAEAGPYADYKTVLQRTLRLIGEHLGFEPTDEELRVFSRSIGDWPAFDETPAALRALETRYRVGVLSNIDDDLFAETAPKLGIDLDLLITAQRVRSYKPGEAHFNAALLELDLPPERILHVAESRFHDIDPASRLGFQTVWVNRSGGGESASGHGDADPDLEVASLAEFIAHLGL